MKPLRTLTIAAITVSTAIASTGAYASLRGSEVVPFFEAVAVQAATGSAGEVRQAQLFPLERLLGLDRRDDRAPYYSEEDERRYDRDRRYRRDYRDRRGFRYRGERRDGIIDGQLDPDHPGNMNDLEGK